MPIIYNNTNMYIHTAENEAFLLRTNDNDDEMMMVDPGRIKGCVQFVSNSMLYYQWSSYF